MKPGDRVELVYMAEDPYPLPDGSRGTVRRTSDVDLGDGPFVQVHVDWDCGRSIMLVVPPDQVRVLGEED